MAYTSHLLAAIPGIRHAFLNAAESAAFNRASLVDIKQVHGNEVLIDDCRRSERPRADGVFSAAVGQPLGVYTADCLPLLMASRDGRFISSVHAGWRGAALGIAERAVARFAERGVAAADVVVAIGPHIRACCYEVSAALYAQLLEMPSGALAAARREALFFSRPQRPSAGSPAAREANSLWFDLSAFAILALEQSGVRRENIDVLERCTYCTPGEVLGSFRRRTHSPAEKTQQISWIMKQG